MPILSKIEIQRRIQNGELVLGVLRDAKGNPVVEPASYDLRAGIVLWKDDVSRQITQQNYDEAKDALHQELVTLKPGQMIFVITHEELKMPADVSGTVYSRNKLQKENILALNAGHVDPGYEGPIIIRLINLGAIPWTLTLGDAVFTVVFHTVRPSDSLREELRRTKKETLEAAKKTSGEAFSNPFHDLYREQIEIQLGRYYSEVESRLRKSFADEFFRRSEVNQLAIALLAGVFGVIIAVAKVPWGTAWGWFKGNQLSIAILAGIFATILAAIKVPWPRVWSLFKKR